MLIYLVTNTANGKKYVGKTTTTLDRRLQQHFRQSRTYNNSDSIIYRAIRKYGESAFIIEQLDTAEDEIELAKKEVEWIAKCGTYENGYNMTVGGEGKRGHVVSEKTKNKLREIGLKRYENLELRKKAAKWAIMRGPLSDEAKENIRKASVGNQWNKGNHFHHTDKAKASIGCAHKGKIISEETKKRIGDGNRGKTISDEFKNKMSKSHLGQIPWNKGVECSEETKQKIGNAHRGKIISDEIKKKLSESKIGRKKMYREDGSWYYGYPVSTTVSSNA